jgi:hypothetical protein
MFASTRSLQDVNTFCERQLKRFYNVVDYENLKVE